MNENHELIAMRHTLAHILAASIKQLWPNAKFGIGPATSDGFYYDLKIDNKTLTQDDIDRIEKKMNMIIKEDITLEQFNMPIDDALNWAQENDQPYKKELLNDLKRSGTTLSSELSKEEIGTIHQGESLVEEVSFYKCGDFTDLCRGPHVQSTSKVGYFKIIRISGAYWRGNINKDQLQRIYGLGYNSKEELDNRLKFIQEAKERDHRKLGQELDLFVISDLVGPGLPMFTPRGTILRNELIAFSEELQKQGGYQEVWAPHMTKIELYKKSGHYDKYPERFDVSSIESKDKFMLKPMNCPHVAQIYASKPRSFRDLPIRYMETTTMYRDEKSGELHGLSRVRSLTQDDSHAFIRPDQIEAEFISILDMVKNMYLVLNMPLSVDLSFRDDSDRYYGDIELWNNAENIIERVAKEAELKYKVVRGEAAFYGPKIDLYVGDALERQWQCATIQLDYVQPRRFDLRYIDSDGSTKNPIMIHKAILGSIERFLSVYIEHTAGKFPVWLAPEQVRLISLNQEESTLDYAFSVKKQAEDLGLRIELDNDNESVGKKIRKAETMKIPYIAVIGPNEIKNNELIPRIRRDMMVQEKIAPMSIKEFLKTVSNEAKLRVSRSSI